MGDFDRRTPGFGQTLDFFCLSCPNLPQVRADSGHFLPFLSEPGPGSDRFWPFSVFSVRTCPGFGQTLDFSCLSCPDLPQVRTNSGPFLPFLSEFAPGSDRLWTFPAFPVRTCLRFGQTRALFCLSCPNLPQVRTDSGLFLPFLSEFAPGSDRTLDFSYLPCPNLPGIRTDWGPFLAFLSELALGSDNNRQFPAFPVRTYPALFKTTAKVHLFN